jgi:hypothetical protein
MVCGFFVANFALAAATVTPASGGANVSIDTTSNSNCIGTSCGTFRPLNGPTIIETAPGDIAVGVHTITLPLGWEFKTDSLITIGIGGGDIEIGESATGITPGANSFSFTVTKGSTSPSPVMFSGLKVRPNGVVTSTSNMFYSGAAGIAGVTPGPGEGSTNFGTLSTVPGAVKKLTFETQPGGVVYGSLLSPQPVVKTQDQFGNDSISGLPANLGVTLTLTSGTGALVGNATLDIGTGAGNGTVTFTDLTVNAVGTKQLMAGATGLISAGSNSFDITPKTLTATITANSKTYDGSNSATFSNPTPVNPAFSDVLTLSDGTATFDDANAGTNKTVTATGLTLSGDNAGNYTYDGKATGAADIYPLEITITPTAGQTKIYGDADPTFAYTPTPALIGTDSFTGALGRAEGKNVGTYAYTLGTLEEGLDNYSLTLAPETFEIIKRDLTVTATGVDKEYDGTSDATVTLSSNEIPGDNLELAYTNAAFSSKTAENGKQINVSGISISGPKSENYALQNTNTTTTANITKKPITLTINVKNKTYNGNTSAIYSSTNPRVLNGVIKGDNVTANADGTKAFENKHVGLNKLVTASGVTLSGIDKDNYEFNGTGTGTATINSRPITVTATTDSKIYDGTTASDETPVITTSLETPPIAEGDVANFIQTYDNKNVGTGKVLTPSGSVNDGNNGANYTVVTFATVSTGEITKAPLTITADGKDKLYGDANPELTASYLGFVNNETASVLDTPVSLSTTADNASSVGTYEITASDATAANYEITFVPGTLTVTPAPLTVTADVQNKIYGDEDPDLTYTYEGLVIGDTEDVFDGSLERVAGENVGDYAISQGSLTAGDNYDIDFVGADLTIEQRALTVTAVTDTKTYDGNTTSNKTPTITAGDLQFDDTPAFTQSFNTPGVGDDKVLTATGIVNDGNNGNNYSYNFSNTAVGEITPLAITITPTTGQTKVYGNSDPAFTYTNIPSLITGDNFSGALSRVTGENVGTYEYELGSLTAGGNYTLTLVPGTFEITKATPVITWENPADIVYGTALSGTELNATADVDGEFVYTPVLETVLNAGEDQVLSVAFTPTDAANYNNAEKTVLITVTPAPLTITADAKSKTYGEADPELTYQITSGSLVNGGTLTGSLSRNAGENVGAYTITSTLANSNYGITFIGADLTITPAPLTITADAKTKSFGTPDPELTYQVTSGTLVEGDLIIGSLTRDVGEDLGTYTINRGTLTAGSNYSITYVPSTLTILDTTPPTVVSYLPSANAVGVDPSSNITVIFSEDVIINNVVISPEVEKTVSFDPETKTATIDPVSSLANNTTYTITLTGVTDTAGNPLEEKTWSFTTSGSYNIQLTKGWNLISLPVVPTSKNIASVLGSAASGIQTVWAYDAATGQWSVYHPDNSDTSDLTSMTAGYGYWINYISDAGANLTGAGNLFLEGNNTPPSRKLKEGWNLIGYYQRPDTTDVSASNALKNNLDGYWKILVGYDNTSKQITFLTGNDQLKPGQGFWVWLNADKSYTVGNAD